MLSHDPSQRNRSNSQTYQQIVSTLGSHFETPKEIPCGVKHANHDPVVDPNDSRFWGQGSMECWTQPPQPRENVTNTSVYPSIPAFSSKDKLKHENSSKPSDTNEQAGETIRKPRSYSESDAMGLCDAYPDDQAVQLLRGLSTITSRSGFAQSDSLDTETAWFDDPVTGHGDNIGSVYNCSLCSEGFRQGGFRLDCGLCEESVHGYCVGISRSESYDIRLYVCPECEADTGRQTTWCSSSPVPPDEHMHRAAGSATRCNDCEARDLSINTCRDVLHHTGVASSGRSSARSAKSQSRQRQGALSNSRPPALSSLGKKRTASKPKPKGSRPKLKKERSTSSGVSSVTSSPKLGPRSPRESGGMKRCYNCKVKQHFSTEKCRKILGHTAPAWDAPGAGTS